MSYDITACCFHCNEPNKFKLAVTFHRAKAIFICHACKKANAFSMESTPLNSELDVSLQNGKPP